MIERLQPADIDDQIVQLVQQCWQEYEMPLLLSRLGAQEDGRIAQIARRESGSLADYIVTRLSDDVRVIRHSIRAVIVGAIPAYVAVDLGGNFDSLLEKTVGNSASPAPRFHPAFWAAFRKTLPEENRRYIHLETPIHFVDAPQTEKIEGLAEIERQYVAGPDADAPEVLQSLRDWLQAHDLDAATFASTSKKDGTRFPSDDLLGRLLRALDSDDLKRVSMPLDIVAKLRREPL